MTLLACSAYFFIAGVIIADTWRPGERNASAALISLFWLPLIVWFVATAIYHNFFQGKAPR